MKLIDFLLFQPFNDLRDKMGATNLGNFKILDILSTDDHIKLKSSGIEIESLDEIKILKDNTLAYKNSRVLLYIRDVSFYRKKYRSLKELPKFHLSFCSTLQEMKKNKRFERYVVATRSDGSFEIRKTYQHQKGHKLTTEKLYVCKNCLNNLKFNGYSYREIQSNRDRIFNDFNLNDFFEQYPRSPIINVPLYTDKTAPINQYSKDFIDIATKLKNEMNWICQASACKIDLSDKSLRKFLHVHHINGQKNDNRRSNLYILCIKCHAEKEYHNHIMMLPEYKEFIKYYAFS